MRVPYESRIVAFIDGVKIEIARFRRAPSSVEIRLLTRGLGCLWQQERTLRNDETITARWTPPGASALAHSQRAGHALKCKHSQ